MAQTVPVSDSQQSQREMEKPLPVTGKAVPLATSANRSEGETPAVAVLSMFLF